jgi:hypothetical protein
MNSVIALLLPSCAVAVERRPTSIRLPELLELAFRAAIELPKHFALCK